MIVVLLLALGCGERAGEGGGDRSADAGGDRDAGTRNDAGSDAGDPDAGGGGGADYRGEVLFFEEFEDTDLASRGWYDGTLTALSSEHVNGASSFECRWEIGATSCADGLPARHQFTPQDAVYLSYWVKYSVGWEGSGRPYHPHEFHFVTTEDDMWVGPAHTHLTSYIEQVGGVARLALQDSANVDLGCILRNDDSIVGCDGDFDSWPFTEARSVCACNGLEGDLDGRDCFPNGDGTWYSSRSWASDGRVFTDEAGPSYESDWHFVEAYFRMNEIPGGVGVADGLIRYWIDGDLRISSDRILMRTGQHPAMQWNQFLVTPYIGDGSPIVQSMWIDDLTVAAGR